MRNTARAEKFGTLDKGRSARRVASKGEPSLILSGDQRSQQRLAATGRAFAILQVVASSAHPLDVLDIASALSLPRATVYRLIEWFMQQGYLAREPGRRRIIIGPRLGDLALNLVAASVRNDVPHVVLQRVARALNETCNLGTLVNGEVVYLDRVEVEHWPLRLHYAAGARVPLHCSAMGKLFLAMAPPARRQRLLRALDLKRFTGNTITERGRLESELRQIAKEQVSFDEQEFLVGVFCMAVPVLGSKGEICAALAVQAPEARLNRTSVRTHLPILRRAGAELADFFRQKP